MAAPEILSGGDTRLLLLCDHASCAIPDDIDLGLGRTPRDLAGMHIAVDIGTHPLTTLLSQALDAPAVLASVSRLVVDLHREPDHPGLIPTESDGHAIPGNVGVDRAARVARFFDPYHAAIADLVARNRPELIVAVHSFTPRLESGGDPRPWPIGILYNRHERAAQLAIAFLRGEGLNVGDNEPYSGKLLNATLNRHAEAHDIPGFSIEVRNDLIRDTAGQRSHATLLGRMIRNVRNRLASEGSSAT